MGRTHTLSAAAGWLGGCAAATAVGWQPSAHTIVVGGLVAAGAALLPDIDHPDSTISGSLGPVTGFLAGLVHGGGERLRRRSCAHCRTRRSRGGHRAVTHTALFAVAVGVLLCLAGWFAGARAGLPVVWVATGLAARVTLSRRRRGTLGAAVIATLVTATASGAGSWWWVGVPVAWGVLAHSLGDAATVSGAPLAWPITVRGCRWTPIGLPRPLRFRTGQLGERVVWWALLVSGLGLAGYLAAG